MKNTQATTSATTLTILSGASFAFIAQIAGYVIQFFSQRIVLSELTKEENGVISFTLTICTAIFGFMVEAGLGGIAIRDIARHPERKTEYLRGLFTIRLVTSVIATLIVGIIAFFTYRDYIPAMIFASLTMIIAGRTPLLRAVFEIEHRAQTRLTIVSLLAMLDLALYFLFLSLHQTRLTPQDIFSYQLLAAIPGFLILLFINKAYHYAHVVTDRSILLEMLREARPLMILTLLMYTHVAIDIFALRSFAPGESLGIYGAASNAAMLGMAIFSVANSIYAPYLSRSYHNNPKGSEHHILRSMYGIAFILILAAAACVVLAPWIIQVFTKNKYADNVFEFRLQFWSSVVMNLLQFGVVIVTSIGKQQRQIRIGIALVIGSLLSDYYCISHFQAAGMIYAKTISNGLALIVFFIVMRDILSTSLIVNFFLRFLGLIAVAFFATQLTASLGVVQSCIVVFVAISMAAIGLGFFTSFERQLVRKLLGK